MVKKYKPKRKKQNKHTGFFRVLIFFTVMALSVSAVFFNIDKLEKYFGLNTQRILGKTNVYLLKYYSFDDESKATESAFGLKQMGGAGFIKKEDGYTVYLSTYPSIEKANAVKQNLESESIKTEVVELAFDEFKLVNSSQFNVDTDLLKSHLNSYNFLYDIFEKINTSNADYSLQKIHTYALGLSADYQKFLNQKTGEELAVCQIYIKNLLDTIESISLADNPEWAIQYSLIKIAFDYKSMLQSLKKVV